MAVWKRKCAGALIVIHNADHLPPHCHVQIGSLEYKVGLHNLEVMKPGGALLKAPLKACLKRHQVEMLQAWENVKILGRISQ